MTVHVTPLIPRASMSFAPRLTESEAKKQASLLRALADSTRLRILSILLRHDGDICVREIVDCFELEQPTISHHLRTLQEAGLIDSKRKALFTYYYVRRDALEQAQDIVRALLREAK